MTTPSFESIVHAAVDQVLRTQFRETAVALGSTPEMPVGPGAWLHSSVAIFGQLSSDVVLSVPDELAGHLAARMLSLPDGTPVDDSDKRDLAGELCNMLAGRISEAFHSGGHFHDLGTPTVSRELSTGAASPELLFSGTWQCTGQTFSLAIHLRPTQA